MHDYKQYTKPDLFSLWELSAVPFTLLWLPSLYKLAISLIYQPEKISIFSSIWNKVPIFLSISNVLNIKLSLKKE